MTTKTETDKKAAEKDPKSPEKTSTVAESEKTGEVTTDTGATVEATSPAIPFGAEHKVDDSPKALTYEDMEDLVGELEYGESGYLPLDDKGYIKGPAKRGMPPKGERGAPVQRIADTRTMPLATPSGAPITERLNPDPMRRDLNRDQTGKGVKNEAPKEG